MLIIILIIKVQSLRNLVYAWADHVKKFFELPEEAQELRPKHAAEMINK